MPPASRSRIPAPRSALRLALAFLLAPALTVPAVSAAPAAAAPADWPSFRGPGGQGTSPGRGLPITWSAQSNLVWKVPLPGPGGSSPVVSGDRILVTGYSGYAVPGIPGGDLRELQRHLLCLERATGKLLWKRDIPAAQPEEIKVRDHGYASSTPCIDGDRVYAFFGKSGVFAFRLDGTLLWHADVGTATHGWGSASSPVVHGDLLLVNASVECESLVALDKASGREVWRAGGMKESWNTPRIVPTADGREEVVLAILGKVLGLDPATGAPLWSCATGIAWYMVPSLLSHADTVYCVGGRTGGALAVRTGGRGDVTATHRLWTLAKGSNVPSPLLHEGHLYWLHETLGIATCADAATGKLIYEERLPNAGPFYASPVLAEGRIYAFTRNGVGFVLAAQPAFQVLARNELGDRSSFDASPAVIAPRLLVRSDRFLYCLGAAD